MRVLAGGEGVTVSPLLPGDSCVPRLPLVGQSQRGAPAWPRWPHSHLCFSYSLSCELEPPSESASNTLRSKKSTAIVKRWSE